MALIKCPDCGKEFSDAAAACPNCGRPNAPPVKPATTPAKRSMGCGSIGCLALVVLFVIGVIANESRSPAEKQRDAQQGQAIDNQIAAEEAVKAQLRDPGSAQFRDVRVVRHEKGVAVCGQVNAKNGFGGFTGFTDFIYIQTAVLRTSDNDAQFVRIWNKTCR